MYRCNACDTPAQHGHAGKCPLFRIKERHPDDPWGFKEEPVKLDIQAGVKVRVFPDSKEAR